MKKELCFTLLLLAATLCCHAQTFDADTNQSPVAAINKFLDKISGKAGRLQQNIEKSVAKSLKKLEKQEQLLQHKLAKKDSAAATRIFGDIAGAEAKTNNRGLGRYTAYQNELNDTTQHFSYQEYIPELDSTKTTLLYLQAQVGAPAFKNAGGNVQRLATATQQMQALETRLQQAANVKDYIRQRRDQLKTELQQFGMVKDLQRYNKEVYYYQQQINEYKAVLKDPQRAAHLLLAMLNRNNTFSNFFKTNSQLAQLFRLPDNYGTAQSLQGLQTRSSVESLLQQRFGSANITTSGGGAGGGYLQQQMQQAQGELSALKDKLQNSPLGPGGEMPDFKPNSQKTKRFLKRIEYGANIQSQRTYAFLPVTSDIALTAGYKLNDRSVIGVGAAYKMGWGNGWKHIRLSHEGIGLRSYIDWKLKPIFGKIEGFWLSGGYEQNYMHSFAKLQQVQDIKAWQQSGLIGITKKYKVGKKTSTMQLLWDFLSYSQVPRRQAVVFRVGWVF